MFIYIYTLYITYNICVCKGVRGGGDNEFNKDKQNANLEKKLCK